MIARIVSYIVAIVAIATAAGVLVVSASFALYALLRLYIGPPGAAACVTLAAAVLIGLLALIFFRKGAAPKLKAEPDSPLEKITAMVRDRPAIAAAAAAAAGLLAWRNPVVVSTVLRLLEPRPAPKKR